MYLGNEANHAPTCLHYILVARLIFCSVLFWRGEERRGEERRGEERRGEERRGEERRGEERRGEERRGEERRGAPHKERGRLTKLYKQEFVVPAVVARQ